jgi:hypothetical protein
MSSSEIVSFLQNAKHRFGDFAKVSYRVSGTCTDGTHKEDCFLWELSSVKDPECLYLRVAQPHSTRVFDITPQLLIIQRALRKHKQKETYIKQ